MKGLNTDHIISLTGARHFGQTVQGEIVHLLIDSRKLVFPESTLFFAIKTDSGDGHKYIEDLYLSGVRHFVIADEQAYDKFPEASFYIADDVVGALQLIASAHRQQFGYPVIAVTGSNGKTIVKEWLNFLLTEQKHVVRSPRSYNSQLGVPLSIWQMQEEHDLAIIEAGISEKGEMQKLAAVIRPDLGIITNIGEAHNEGFSSLQEKLNEKLSLFSNSKLIVYCRDHEVIHAAIKQFITDGKVEGSLSWGQHDASDIVVHFSISGNKETKVEAKYKGTAYRFTLPYRDAAELENAMHCFAMCVELNVVDRILDRFHELPPVAMRLEMRDGQNGCVVINDSYNADLNGLVSALEFVSLQHPGMKRSAVLSDLTGVSGDDTAVYAQIAELLKAKGVHQLYAVGDRFIHHVELFREVGVHAELFSNTESLLTNLRPIDFSNQLVLVKGARSYRMERVSQLLESKVHRTRLEINLSSLAHNLKQYRLHLQPGTRVMAMVKAFSYGAGSIEVANLLQFNRVEYLAVAYVDEGVTLRKAGVRLPIMIMNTEPSAFSSLLEYDLEPEIYSSDIAEKLISFLHGEGITFFPVHIKLDTGMHRLGFDSASLNNLLDIPDLNTVFRVKSVFTHLVSSEDPAHDEFTQKQMRLFDQLCLDLRNGLGYDFFRHVANSAAITRHSSAQYDMVRLGIGLYGIDPGNTELNLIESGTLKTTIAQIRQVAAGESVGYGRKAILTRDSKIATVRIGYADGYPRSLGNGKGSFLIRGHEVSTIGNVCMDMTMVDVTGYDDIQTDDDVLVFGPDRSIAAMAKAAGTIPYEIMTGISERVPRVYVGE
ncbi:MAG: bifunctional UDP-N-acetylmuramoyl-tripeptide:D-alanyl-D-alanine ligase/alanine racemase [bacterium]